MPAPKIDVYATFPHYIDHLAPVWSALRKTRRGTFYVPSSLVERARSLGVEAVAGKPGPGGPILVAASGNLSDVLKSGRKHAAIMEHGSGQSYGGAAGPFGTHAAESSSYAGGGHRDAELFLHPGPHPAARDAARYPNARVEVVGCPKLDSLPARDLEAFPEPTVAFSFHWDTSLAPETRSSWLYYRAQLAVMAARHEGYRLIGHGHPRIIDRLAPWYEDHGVPVVRDFADVCRQADLYACDGVSTLYEFASTGRPVLVLNAPFYRREVEHGLRNWSAAHVGRNIDEPYDIHAAVPYALSHPQVDRERREDALSKVYAYREGAAKRAARVLEDWATGTTA